MHDGIDCSKVPAGFPSYRNMASDGALKKYISAGKAGI
jgi:hypothetical protein